MPSPEAHRTRALRDAGLAEGLAREAPEWAAVLLAHAAHHLLLGWSFARAGEAKALYQQAQALWEEPLGVLPPP